MIIHFIEISELLLTIFFFLLFTKLFPSKIVLISFLVFPYAWLMAKLDAVCGYRIFVAISTLFYLSSFLLLLIYLAQKKRNIEEAIFTSSAVFITNYFLSSIINSLLINPFEGNHIKILFLHLSLFCLALALLYFPARFLFSWFKRATNRKQQITSIIMLTVSILVIMNSYLFYGELSLSIEKMSIIVAILVVFFMLFFISKQYLFFLEEKHKIEIRNKTYEATLLYTQEIEERYKELRKAQHDYKNLLLSLESYILERDYDGLTDYFTRLKSNEVSSALNIGSQLPQLQNIVNLDIKGILMMKLLALPKDNFDVNIEIKESINFMNRDTVLLVRAIGIILDNAIEELMVLGSGRLDVAFMNFEEDIVIVISNTCKEIAFPLSKLKKEGVSTKGDDRGFGLTILSEIVDQLNGVYLETSYKNDQFTQVLTISKEG